MHHGNGSGGPGRRYCAWPVEDDEIPVVGPTPDRAQTYVAPQALPPVTDHKTLEIETVRLAPEIDPRRMLTQPSLARVLGNVSPSSVPPPVSHPSRPSAADCAARGGRWRQRLLWAGAVGALLATATAAVLIVRARVGAAIFVASFRPQASIDEPRGGASGLTASRGALPGASPGRVAPSAEVTARADVPCGPIGASGARAAVLQLSRSLVQAPSGTVDGVGEAPVPSAINGPAPVVTGGGRTDGDTPSVPRRLRTKSLF